MADPIRLMDVRLLLVWAEAFNDLLATSPPKGAPMGFMGSRSRYAARFEGIRSGAPDPLGLSLPWSKPEGGHFWAGYLERIDYGAIDGGQAWKYSVPLRGSLALKVELPTTVRGRASASAWHFPQGIGVILSVTLDGPLSLEQVVDAALAVKASDRLTVTEVGKDRQSMTSSQFADLALALARTASLSTGTGPAFRFNDPFTLLAVVEGDGVDARQPVKKDTQRALHALTSWRRTWRDDALPNLADHALPAGSAPAGHVVYRDDRARAIWFPSHFTSTDERIFAVSCYAKNLMMAALQVDVLLGLVVNTAKLMSTGQRIPPNQEDSSQYAAGGIGRLYMGKGTYRSWSCRAQIADSGHLAEVDEVRARFGMDTLI